MFASVIIFYMQVTLSKMNFINDRHGEFYKTAIGEIIAPEQLESVCINMKIWNVNFILIWPFL